MEMEMTSLVWEEIERSESYLVCSMFEEAASSATSVLKRIRDNPSNLSVQDDGNLELYDMMESTGMVLVQSLKELQRTSRIVDELRAVFVSVEAIPVQVLLTGVCFQISEGSTLGVREFLEEFLCKWRNLDEIYFVLIGAEGTLDFEEGCDSHFVMGIGKYMEVVELYAVTLLAKVSNDVELAISWVEKAALPEEKRQGLLRRLHSLCSSNVTNMSQDSSSHLLEGKNAADSSRLPKATLLEGSSKALKKGYQLNGESNSKQAILKLTSRANACLWFFRNISFKFGNVRLVISRGRIFLGFLIFLIYYVLHRNRASLQRIVRRQVLAIKKAMVDLWQLAFSYQVNPLAAVQSLPAATSGSR
ncbi:hypothetical protein SLE2022_272910 [Rubroshorea leprosula]